MTLDHADLAHAAFTASLLPSPPRSVESALPFITRLLSMLPASERFGYVSGPRGGENVAALPDGRLVRISRVMTPDGQIYKVLNDAPNGNPQWVLEDIRPDLYIAYQGPVTLPAEPPAADSLKARLGLLEMQVTHLHGQFIELAKHVGIINKQIADLTNRTTPTPALPDYIGRVGPFTIISKPRV